MIKDYHGIYTLGLSVKGKDLDLDPSAFAFSMIDSITSFYSRGTLSIHDASGMLSESFIFVPGTEVELTLGIKDSVVKNTYIIEKGPHEEFKADNASGVIELNLVHKYKYDQVKKSRSFSNRISEVVRQVVSSHPFSDIIINDTGNNSKWLQGLQTDAKFIADVLLPRAFSSNSESTPFYAFIDSKNRFHFQNINGMMGPRGSNCPKYIYRPNSDPEKVYNVIISMKSFGPKKFNTRTTFFEFDPSKGEFVEEEFSIKQMRPDGAYTAIGSSLDRDTTYENLFWNKGRDGKESRKGRMLNHLRDSFFLENVFALVPFNPDLTSGMKFLMEVPLLRNDSSLLSRRFTSEYLVLLTEHVWSNSDKRAYTKLLLGRKNSDILSSAATKLELYGGS